MFVSTPAPKAAAPPAKTVPPTLKMIKKGQIICFDLYIKWLILLCILGGRYLTTFETSIVGNEFQLTLVQHCNDGY